MISLFRTIWNECFFLILECLYAPFQSYFKKRRTEIINKGCAPSIIDKMKKLVVLFQPIESSIISISERWSAISFAEKVWSDAHMTLTWENLILCNQESFNMPYEKIISGFWPEIIWKIFRTKICPENCEKPDIHTLVICLEIVRSMIILENIVI